MALTNQTLLDIGAGENLNPLAKQSKLFTKTGKVNNCVMNTAIKHYIAIAIIEENELGNITVSDETIDCLTKILE